jgi:uncharacterized membrane protein (UPF0182 family)
VYYVAARGWQLKRDMPGYVFGQELDLRDLGRLGRLETGLLKGLAALFLVALAAQFWLGRYELMLSDHGNLMVGIDYLQQNLGLPLQTIKAGAAVLAAILVIAGRRKLAIACAVVLVIDWLVPPLAASLYVRPNELTLEKPYIVRHIETTRAAYGLDTRAKVVNFNVKKRGVSILKRTGRCWKMCAWDWRVSRHTLVRASRCVLYLRRYGRRPLSDRRAAATLLAPRELDLNQLGDAIIAGLTAPSRSRMVTAS